MTQPNDSVGMRTVPDKFYDTGETKWMHGRVTEYHANREPLRWLLGPCPHCGAITSNYGSRYSCHDYACRNSSNIFTLRPAVKTPFGLRCSRYASGIRKLTLNDDGSISPACYVTRWVFVDSARQTEQTKPTES